MRSPATGFYATLRIARSGLRRGGIVPVLALIALVLIPLLYAALYLYADDDTPAQLDELPAAVVNEDTGDLGRAVTDALVASGDFHLEQTGSREAIEGIRDGRYLYAVVIPSDFSALLREHGRLAPRAGTLTLTTDGADNYLSHPVAARISNAVRETIAARAGNDAANRFLVGFASVHGATERAAADARQLAADSGTLLTGQSDLARSTGRLAEGSTRLATGLTTLRGSSDSLPEHTRGLADAADTVAGGHTRVADAGRQLATTSTRLRSALGDARGQLSGQLAAGGLSAAEIQYVLRVLDDVRAPVDQAGDQVRQVTAQVGTLAESARRLARGARQLANAMPPLAEGIAQSSDGANEVSGGLARLTESQDGAVTGTEQLAQGVTTLRNELDTGLRRAPGAGPEPPGAEGGAARPAPNAIAEPVAVTPASASAAATLGAGLAPFVIAIATWVGALALFLWLRPLSRRALAAGVPSLRVALGGWLIPAVLGIAQVLVLYAAVTWPAGVTVANPSSALGFALLTAVTFTAIVHALGAWFGRAGLLAGVGLLALQLVSTGGLPPGQAVPDVLYPLYVLLPMGHAIDGLRHLFAGSAGAAATGAVVLLTYLVVALAASVAAARKRRMWTATQVARL